MGIEVIAPLWPIAVRVFGGWAKNSFADGKIQKVELLRLGKSVVRVGALGVLLYVGIDGLVNIDWVHGVGLASVLDVIRSEYIKKK